MVRHRLGWHGGGPLGIAGGIVGGIAGVHAFSVRCCPLVRNRARIDIRVTS
jgi:hypothetical protein